MHCLTYIETPNGDDPALIKQFTDGDIRMYENAELPTTHNAYIMLQSRMVQDVKARVSAAVESFAQDEVLMAKIPGLYPEILKRGRNRIVAQLSHDKSYTSH